MSGFLAGMVMEQRHLLHAIPDPLDYPHDEYDAFHWLPLREMYVEDGQDLAKPYMPKERIHLVKRTLAYPYILWAPEAVHWQRNGEDVEAPYWKFDTEPMRTNIIHMVSAQPKPPASSHPSMSVSIGDYFGTTFYLTLRTTVHWHTITGWVEKSEVGTFDATH